MIAVWIVAGILLALFLLLLCPVTIVVGFQKEFTIKIRYLFFTYQVAPPKEKPKKEAKEFPESGKKEQEIKISGDTGREGHFRLIEAFAPSWRSGHEDGAQAIFASGGDASAP